METLRVSAKSKPNTVAGAVAANQRGRYRRSANCGVGAFTNQAIKAIAIARGFLMPSGIQTCLCAVVFRIPIDAPNAPPFACWCKRKSKHKG